MIMFALRRAASRALASPSLTSSPIRSSQTIRSYSLLSSRSQLAPKSLSFSLTWQRRFASEDAERRVTEESESQEQFQQDEVEQRAVGEQSGSSINEAVEQAAQRTEDAVAASSAPQAIKDATSSVAGAVSGAAGTGQNKEFDPHTVFCGNLFYHVTEAQLHEFMSKYGEVEETHITRDPRGLSRGFGFVKFKEPAGADRAIQEAHNQMFEGRLLSAQRGKSRIRPQRTARASDVNQDRAPKAPTRTLWIGNMSYDMSDTDLNNLFRPLKNVIDVRVAIDRRTGQARGFAHADFIDVESATEAYKQLENQVVYGRKLKLDYGATYAPERRNLGGNGPSAPAPEPTNEY